MGSFEHQLLLFLSLSKTIMLGWPEEQEPFIPFPLQQLLQCRALVEADPGVAICLFLMVLFPCLFSKATVAVASSRD